MKVGNKIGFGEFVNEEKSKLYYASKIEVDGKLMYIKDENTKSGIVEAETEGEALRKAAEIRDSILKK